MVSYSLCWLSQKAAVLCWEKEVRVSGSEQTKNNWAESRGGCGDWSISYKEGLRKLKLFILGKTRPRGQKLKQEISSEYGGKLLCCEGDRALEQSAPERLWSFLPCWYSQSSWRQSCVTCWSWTCFSRGVGPGCFKLQLFCPSLCTFALFTSGWFSSVFSRAPGCLSAPVGWGFVPLCWFG